LVFFGTERIGKKRKEKKRKEKKRKEKKRKEKKRKEKKRKGGGEKFYSSTAKEVEGEGEKGEPDSKQN